MVTLYHSRYYWMFQQHSTANCQFHADNLINHENKTLFSVGDFLTYRPESLWHFYGMCVIFSIFSAKFELYQGKQGLQLTWPDGENYVTYSILWWCNKIKWGITFFKFLFFSYTFCLEYTVSQKKCVWPHLYSSFTGSVRTLYLPSWWCSICPSDLINSSIVCRESVVVSRRLADYQWKTYKTAGISRLDKKVQKYVISCGKYDINKAHITSIQVWTKWQKKLHTCK